MARYSLVKDSDVQYTVFKDDVPTYVMKFKNKSWSCNCPARKACKHLGMIPVEDQVKRFPRAEIDAVVKKLEAVLWPYRHAVCGSYRRGAETSKDIDVIVLMLEEDFRLLPRALATIGFQYEAGGSHKFSGTLNGVPVDVDRIEEAEYFAAHLLYRTGPAALNIKMRALAKELGFTLSERVKAESEEELFAMVGMAYIDPKERK